MVVRCRRWVDAVGLAARPVEMRLQAFLLDLFVGFGRWMNGVGAGGQRALFGRLTGVPDMVGCCRRWVDAIGAAGRYGRLDMIVDCGKGMA